MERHFAVAIFIMLLITFLASTGLIVYSMDKDKSKGWENKTTLIAIGIFSLAWLIFLVWGIFMVRSNTKLALMNKLSPARENLENYNKSK